MPVGFEEWMQVISLVCMAVLFCILAVIAVKICKETMKKRRIRHANKESLGRSKG